MTSIFASVEKKDRKYVKKLIEDLIGEKSDDACWECVVGDAVKDLVVNEEKKYIIKVWGPTINQKIHGFDTVE